MIIKNFNPYIGQHCETTSTGSLLKQIGIELSEPMLFGIGEGLGFVFWKMKTMDFPFLGGRVKTDALTQNICKNLNLQLEVRETSSTKKAWENVRIFLDQGKAVGLKLDCYHLDYFTNKIHFAGHYASMYGYDEKYAYLNDTSQQGRNAVTTLANLALARNEKGPMSSRNLSYTIDKGTESPDLKKVIPIAIKNNAKTFLNPPIKNLYFKGMLKTSKEIFNWFNSSKNIEEEFKTSAMLMERAGTGGSLFRNLYRDFIKESSELLKTESLNKISMEYAHIAKQWKNIADMFVEIAETENIQIVQQASELLVELSQLEKTAMEHLATSDL